MSIRRLLVPFAATLLAIAPALAQDVPAPSDGQTQMLLDEAKELVASDSAAIDAIRNDPEASGQDYNRAAMLYHAARSLLDKGDAAAASDSAGAAEDAANSAAQGVHDLFDRQDQAVGAGPMRDSTVDNTERPEPDGVPQRTFRDSLPFGDQPDSPDGVPQRMHTDSLPFGDQKAEPVDSP
jgi:hypothetical protein